MDVLEWVWVDEDQRADTGIGEHQGDVCAVSFEAEDRNGLRGEPFRRRRGIEADLVEQMMERMILTARAIFRAVADD